MLQGIRSLGHPQVPKREKKDRSHLDQYASEPTAEQMWKTTKKIGLKSAMMRVKASTNFKKKK